MMAMAGMVAGIVRIGIVRLKQEADSLQGSYG